MYITSLYYITLIWFIYPVLRMPSKDMTSQVMEKMKTYNNETLKENKNNLKEIKCKDSECSEEIEKDCMVTQHHTSIDICLLFLYHITSKGSTQSILGTTTLFFWKVSAFPLNSKSSSTDRQSQTGVRKVRNIPTRSSFNTGDCQTGWFEYEERCYKVSKKIMNYKSSTKYCQSLDSQLVNIQTINENRFVRNLANYQGIPGYLWTAVHKLCINCTETVSGYSNWLSGQPSGISTCVTMNSYGQWRDFDCGYMFEFLCEKAVRKPYTEIQLLIALLVPVFSCLTVAISFTTVLLVSSVRRGNQPFKVASRYRRTKKERKPTNWDMVDILRRASLTRRGSRLKPQRASAPSIEITKAEDNNGITIISNGIEKKRWYKRRSSNTTKNLQIPDDRRQSSNSSGSSGNSSLYELLARLNKMEFEGSSETRINENEEIELKDINEQKNGFKPVVTEDEIELSGSNKQLVETIKKIDEPVNGGASFRNMAFRDSVVSVETNGSGVTRVTSVQQMNQRDSMGTIEDMTDDMELYVSLDGSSRSHVCTRDTCSPDSARDQDGQEETEASKNTQTVRADVHISNKASSLTEDKNFEKVSDRKPVHSKGKVIWTYSL